MGNHLINECALSHPRGACNADDIGVTGMGIQILKNFPHLGHSIINVSDKTCNGPDIPGYNFFNNIIHNVLILSWCYVILDPLNDVVEGCPRGKYLFYP